MEKPKVGDKMFVVDVGNRARYGGAEHREVMRVGRKYFYLNIRGETKFDIETRTQITVYSKDYQVYDSEQQYLDYNEKYKIEKELSEALRYAGHNKYSLSDIRKVAEILKLEGH